jgi:hypothetical protein
LKRTVLVRGTVGLLGLPCDVNALHWHKQSNRSENLFSNLKTGYFLSCPRLVINSEYFALLLPALIDIQIAIASAISSFDITTTVLSLYGIF